MNESTTEETYGIFAENSSVGSIFNWTDSSNETTKEDKAPNSTTLFISAIYLTVVGKAPYGLIKITASQRKIAAFRPVNFDTKVECLRK